MAKFVVTKGYGNEVEVTLHYETKDKIRKILAYGGVGAVYAVIVARYLKARPKPATESQD